MHFFNDIAVICCVPLADNTPTNARQWHDTVEYRLGINASTESNADSIAERAAQHSVDRDAQYIGGVVQAVSTNLTTQTELDEYSDYLMRPVSEPGIFYVSGVTYGAIAFADAAKFDERIIEFGRRIEQQGRPSRTRK